MNSDESEGYEHSGTWTCEHCGTEEEIEHKIGVLEFAISHNCDEATES